MTITIHQTILNIMKEDRDIIFSRTVEGYVITPAEGKILRNKLTGERIPGAVGGLKKEQILNFEEVDE